MNATGRPIRSESIQPGQSFGKFYLVQTIGEGGTSKIFKALQQPINRLVALKIPSFPEAGNLLTPDEFLSEATLMARLEHGNIVRIYDFGVSDDRAFICMEFVEGQNLQELVESRGPLPLSATVALGLQLLDGLAYAHSQGVLHLDLSPANAVLARTGVAKLLDFGMAGKKPQAASGVVMGTPAFLSPEHALGQAGAAQSDLFSFASLLFYAAAGEPLFDAGPGNTEMTGMLSAIGSAREKPPEDRLRRLAGPLSRIVTAALRGADAESTGRSLKELWNKLEGAARPEAVLRRELGWDLPALPNDADGKAASSGELQERFLKLRSQGKHREAMALLEAALRRHPENPALRELLSLPPEKAKSIPATMAMESAASADARQPATDPRPSATAPLGKARSGRKIGFALGILAVTLPPLAWMMIHAVTRANARPPAAATPQAIKPVSAPATPVAEPAAEMARSNPVATNQPPGMPEAVAPQPVGARQTQPAPVHAAGARAKIAPAHAQHLPPTLSVSGPAGTRISVDDGREWAVPGPRAGWAVSPGLINISLTLPGAKRPITSSLFVSADSMYVLKVEDDGGFSLTRRAR